ncbi:MAG: hypothetical protein V1792_17870 [Pseudomonadota bacterium]
MKLPKNREITIAASKITGYLLSETHPVGSSKAKYFRALGYSEESAGRLHEDLVRIAAGGDVAKMIGTPHGTKYVVDGDLTPPSGRKVRVRTIWIARSGDDIPRFVTAYPAHAGRRGEIP